MKLRKIESGWYTATDFPNVHVFKLEHAHWGFRVGTGENRFISHGFGSKRQVVHHVEKHLDKYLAKHTGD